MTSLQEFREPSAINPIRRRWVTYAFWGTVLIVTPIVAFIYKYNSDTVGSTPIEQPRHTITVTTTKPIVTNWPMTISASGAIEAWQEASIGSQIGGYQIIDIDVNVGDYVKKGQVLARINKAVLLAEQIELQARAEQADADKQRALTLEKGAISEQAILSAVTDSKIADAGLAANSLSLLYTDVVAPDDGVISARLATVGAVVTVGQELFRMIRQERLEWRGELTAQQLAQITLGQEVLLQLPDGNKAGAIVRKISPTFDHNTRLAIVYADINAGSSARAGMYVQGKFILGESSALILPAECVIIRDGRNYVSSISEEEGTQKVSLQKVSIGRRLGNQVEITQGLDASDLVVAEGAGFLSDGDFVRVVSPMQSSRDAQL